MAEGEYQRRRDQQDRRQLQQVAQRRGILERMRRVDAEEAAAVGTQLLDGNLAGRRPHRQALLAALQGGGGDVIAEVLRHALPHQQHRQHQAQRQQAVEHGAGDIHPEIAQAVAGLPRQTPAQHHQHRQAHRRADEVLHAKAEHLAEIAQLRLTAVGLPVGVGDKAHRRVERQRHTQPGELLRVERQGALQQQHAHQRQQADQGEGQQRQGVAAPALLLLRVDASHAVAQALHRLQQRAEPGALALHHPVEIAPEKRGRCQHQQGKGRQQQPVVVMHGRLLNHALR